MGGQDGRCAWLRSGVGCSRMRGKAEPMYCPTHALEAAARGSARPVADVSGVAPASALATIDQARQNAGKPPFHLVAMDGLAVVAWVAGFGAAKYSARGWERSAAKGVFSWSDCVRALISHTAKLMAGQRLDAESGLPHVGHIAWNALALCAMLVRGNGRDDLPGQGSPPVLGPDGTWDPGPAYVAAIERVRAAKGAAP